jgi:hypothetical protein
VWSSEVSKNRIVEGFIAQGHRLFTLL